MPCRRLSRGSAAPSTPQPRPQQMPDRLAQGLLLRRVLPDDHRRPQGRRRRRIGVLVAVGGLGEGHQDRGRPAHRQLGQAAGAGAADHQIGVLQQAWHVIAEGALQVERLLETARLRVAAAAEVHHPHTGFQQGGEQGSQHPVEPHGPLAAAHHQQQRALPRGHPGRKRGGLQEGSAHGGAREQGVALGQPPLGLGQPHRHPRAQPPQQPRHPPRHAVGFVQHHWHAAASGRQDHRGGDVAAGAEHQLNPLPPDQPAHVTAGQQQPEQLAELAQAPALEAARPHGVQRVAAGHQLPLQPVRHPQPAHRPVRRQGIGDRQGGEEMAPGAAGGDQKPRHGSQLKRRWRGGARLT